MTDITPDRRSLSGSYSFHTTRWSLVLSAKNTASHRIASLEVLCRLYWQPLYGYVLHRGFTTHDAEDLTQAFFARLLEKDWLAGVSQEKGRFRSFLLAALKHFLANEWDRANAQKRGGKARIVNLDSEMMEKLQAPVGAWTSPERAFDKRWALTVVENVMRRLREEHGAAGKLPEYEALKPWLTAERGGIDYQALATALGTEPASARSAIHRLRRRFREAFREQVIATVADPADLEDEIRALVMALGEI
jgi:RNA polymerase sigma-70 factor (ECF subfamily)